MLLRTCNCVLLFCGIFLYTPTAKGDTITLWYDGTHYEFMKSDSYLFTAAPSTSSLSPTGWLNDINSTNTSGPLWELPTTTDGTWGYWGTINKTKFNVTDSLPGQLFYTFFSNSVTFDSSDNLVGISYSQTFQTYQTFFETQPYWLAIKNSLSLFTELPENQKKINANDSGQAPLSWAFNFENGAHFLQSPTTGALGLAYRVISTPEPTTALLLLTGLLLFSSASRRKKG